MLNYYQTEAFVDLGWEFYGPVIGMLVLIGLAVPVWVSLGLGSIALLYITDVLPLSLFGESLFDGIDAFALIAVPLFILTGDVLVRTGLSNKLLDVAEASVGGARAGFGSATVLGCGFFACISGSDAAGAAAVGRMTIDRLVKQGYPKPYACALVAAGACTGILIPPSIAYIIIGLVLGISASTLFLAAAVPGLMVMGAIMLTNVVMNRIHGYENAGQGFSFKRWISVVIDARYALMVPFVILGGIYSGIFTPTEAAAIAVVTTIIIGLFQGTLKVSDFPKMLESSAKVNGVILPIIALSLPLAQTLAALNVPQAFVESMTSITDSHVALTLIMIGILILAGCFMETTPNILILSPILLPLAREIGMDDIQFCIMMVTSLGVGFITPPLGLNLFVVSGLTGTSVLKIAAQSGPYVLSMLTVVLMLAFIPELSLWALD
ncbi:C4-dicarboxylate ABC transporter [Enterovibrio norvegicus]|uniref:TRAP transporter large permease n=1 Tax=Enterovibrio norvegicus TaxID=188144 RepID=UPI000C857B5D|nr:TRAP transporter large permease [Enterovibrio norvegicus]MCC4798077.1 TRAP transporter large permease [Enterovibrio norvegicus]PMH72081.1 C4-dicarboxylate ABC transporter [Enterovibrio norvegicus]PMI38076.1 C4-dicarboxylate ABC transporter [Enterovibrio norvegicus]PMN56701.1 C4-dicarboxylate ABC transporter [Enterovibrio norvegicus]TKF36833.1 TRAP transporter large permease [Enterovibrio norvegicus]